MNSSRVEKFSVAELTGLRNELLQPGIDSRQAAEVLSSFLTGRGYGIAPETAFDAVIRLEGMGCSYDMIQPELERIALVM